MIKIETGTIQFEDFNKDGFDIVSKDEFIPIAFIIFNKIEVES